MTLTFLDTVLWAAGFFLNVALLAVLVYKRRYRVLPWLTMFIGANVGYTIILFFGYRLGSRQTYDVLYWVCEGVDLLLQVGVVLEIARMVLQRSGRWVEGARLRLTLMGVTAPLIALAMALLMKPFALTRLDALLARASLFTTILVFLLFVAIVAASHQLGLNWRSYPVRVSFGLMVWVCTGFVTDTLHAYWRTLGHFAVLENAHMVVFQMVTLMWCFAFWIPERANISIGEPEKLRLERLQRGLKYGQR